MKSDLKRIQNKVQKEQILDKAPSPQCDYESMPPVVKTEIRRKPNVPLITQSPLQ